HDVRRASPTLVRKPPRQPATDCEGTRLSATVSEAPRRISPLARALFLLRFLPLYAAMVVADWLAPKLPRRWPQPRREWKTAHGVSVIVAERGTPGTLAI